MTSRRRVPLVTALAVWIGASTPVVGTGPLAAQEAPDTTPATSASYAVVLASRLNVRAEPSLDATVRFAVERSDTLCVLGVIDDWADVRTRSVPGDPTSVRRGYVARGFISEHRPTAERLAALGCAARGLDPPARDINPPV